MPSLSLVDQAFDMTSLVEEDIVAEGLVGEEMGLDGLQGRGTVCGTIGNKCFDAEVIEFLRSNGVTKFGVVYYTRAEDDCPAGTIAALSAQPISDIIANKLSELVYTKGGSLRPEKADDEQIVVFEVE